jgi:serine/threonine protein phosphatase PrpC
MSNDVVPDPHSAEDADQPAKAPGSTPIGTMSEVSLHNEVAVAFLPPVEVLPDVSSSRVAEGMAAWLTCKSPGKPGPNEDAVAAIPVRDNRGILMVADGLGGHRGGRRASQLMKTGLIRMVKRLSSGMAEPVIKISGVVPVPLATTNDLLGEQEFRSAILNEIEQVNQRLLRSRMGAATTLALVEISKRRVRTYHVGDSEILIVSQRGRIKYSSVSHSPIGYAVESGIMSAEEALYHPDRHLISNVIGSDQMSVELGPWISLSPRDTVLLASDGLFDNLLQEEIVEFIRIGRPVDCVRKLAELARKRMLVPSMNVPSKPDDLSILLYRAVA